MTKNMKKIKLKILGLSYNPSQAGSYVLILSEVKTDRKLPIIIKSNDAQYIALKIEGIEYNMPTTQDLIKSFCDLLGADVNEVYIHNLVEGVFYAKIIFSNAIDTYEVECSIGDAISISVLYKCPIVASSVVMDAAGIYMSNDGKVSDEQKVKNHKKRDSKETVTIESLEKMLQKAVDNEEFEIASQLHSRISELKKNQES
jgi:hypothetical protein